MAGLHQSLVSARTPQLSTTMCLGAAAAAAAAGGFGFGEDLEETRYFAFVCEDFTRSSLATFRVSFDDAH